MKTIHISDGLWKSLRVVAAQRGVTMREVVEEMGVAWQESTVVAVTSAVVLPEEVLKAITQAEKRIGEPDVARELTVELEE